MATPAKLKKDAERRKGTEPRSRRTSGARQNQGDSRQRGAQGAAEEIGRCHAM